MKFPILVLGYLALERTFDEEYLRYRSEVSLFLNLPGNTSGALDTRDETLTVGRFRSR